MKCRHVLKILNIALKMNQELISEEKLKEIRCRSKNYNDLLIKVIFSMKLNLKKLDKESKKFFSLNFTNIISLSSI